MSQLKKPYQNRIILQNAVNDATWALSEITEIKFELLLFPLIHSIRFDLECFALLSPSHLHRKMATILLYNSAISHIINIQHCTYDDDDDIQT